MDGVVIKDRFKIKGRIGHGAFGEIYKGLDLQCLNHEVNIFYIRDVLHFVSL